MNILAINKPIQNILLVTLKKWGKPWEKPEAEYQKQVVDEHTDVSNVGAVSLPNN